MCAEQQVLIGSLRPSFSGKTEHRDLVKLWFADVGLLSMSNSIWVPVWFL